MSNQVNAELIEKAQETLELADFHMEYWTGTMWEKKFDLLKAQVIKDVEQDLGNLYENSLPALLKLIMDSAQEMFIQEYNPNEGTLGDIVHA